MCDPVTLPVSSLTHTPPAAPNPSSSESVASRPNGVARNPWPGDARHRVVEAGDQLGELLVGHARLAGTVVAVQQLAVVHERRRGTGQTLGEADLVAVEDAHQHVVDVADGGPSGSGTG